MEAATKKYYEKRAQVLVKNLQSRHFDAWYCDNKEDALNKALELIPMDATIGWGGAMSAQQIGLLDAVKSGSYNAYDRDSCATMEDRVKMMKNKRSGEVLAYLQDISEQYDMDYFISRGEMVNPAMSARFERVLDDLEAFAPVIGEVLTDPDLPAVQRRFWRELSYHQAYTFYLTQALLAKSKGQDPTPAYKVFVDLVRESEPEFQKSLDTYRILEVTSVYTKLHE